jgi:Skp family chaperone for outer membrane proteins
MKVPKKIKDEVWEYCRLNNISDIDTFMLKTLQQGFNIEKYGTTPFKIGGKELEVIEKEVIKVITATTEVEIIREVPVEIEVIKVVEKIVEVTVTDNELINKLKAEIKELGGEITKLGEDLDGERNTIKDMSNSGGNTTKTLKQQIKNLKIELEMEKNRNYVTPKNEKPKNEKPKHGLNNIIKWVPKDDIKEDLYGE